MPQPCAGVQETVMTESVPVLEECLMVCERE